MIVFVNTESAIVVMFMCCDILSMESWTRNVINLCKLAV